MGGDGFEENKTAVVTENSVSLLVGKGNLIEVEVKANEKPVKAILDTGACVSVASAKLARTKGWKIDDRTVNLFGANSMPLKCIGSTLIKIELTLNNTLKATNYRVAVVENLATPFLIGFGANETAQNLCRHNRQLGKISQRDENFRGQGRKGRGHSSQISKDNRGESEYYLNNNNYSLPV